MSRENRGCISLGQGERGEVETVLRPSLVALISCVLVRIPSAQEAGSRDKAPTSKGTCLRLCVAALREGPGSLAVLCVALRRRSTGAADRAAP